MHLWTCRWFVCPWLLPTFFKTAEGKLCFRICRVACEACGKTHALLLSSMVPYSQLSLQDQVQIIAAYESDMPTAGLLKGNESIDESTIRYVIRNYRRHWKQRIVSHSIATSSVSTLIRQYFLAYFRQFMQIKRTINYLFLNTT